MQWWDIRLGEQIIGVACLEADHAVVRDPTNERCEAVYKVAHESLGAIDDAPDAPQVTAWTLRRHDECWLATLVAEGERIEWMSEAHVLWGEGTPVVLAWTPHELTPRRVRRPVDPSRDDKLAG
jgi:hypothetical protein